LVRRRELLSTHPRQDLIFKVAGRVYGWRRCFEGLGYALEDLKLILAAGAESQVAPYLGSLCRLQPSQNESS
jgi:hypothetical protein